MSDEIEPDRWYWDRRTNKAYRPVEREDGSVTMLTIWHEDEVEGALDAGALAPVDEIVFGSNDTFDLIDSFRLPDLEADEGEGRR